MHGRWPTIPLWQTEICCMPLVPRFSFADLVFYAEQLIRDVESGVSTWLYWNMILDETGGPWAISDPHRNPDGNLQPALVTIHRTTHEVDYTGPFWGLAHFSRWVRPGAVRIETTPAVADGVRAISFRGTDGTLVSVLLNGSAGPRSPILVHHGRGAQIDLPAGSIATVRWTD
jgi:glucosylceramidase